MIENVNSNSSNVGSSVINDNAQLEKDDFLRLLTTQLENQDPLDPSSQEDMIATLTQFSTLEQMTNMSQALESLLTENKFSQAVSLIGRDVKGLGVNGDLMEGKVLKVVSDQNGSPLLQLNEGTMSYSALIEIQ